MEFLGMLDNFFIYGAIPENAMKGTYVPFLVLLSYVIASFGSYTGLTLATGMFKAKTAKAGNILHWGGAFALGAGIWSMHFIGMLAFRMDMPMAYIVPFAIMTKRKRITFFFTGLKCRLWAACRWIS